MNLDDFRFNKCKNSVLLKNIYEDDTNSFIQKYSQPSPVVFHGKLRVNIVFKRIVALINNII